MKGQQHCRYHKRASRSKTQKQISNSDEEECELRPAALWVQPITQEKQRLNLSYRHLKLLPEHPMPHIIRYLHVSHNDLTTLIGLEAFSQLQSLSVSHNRLDDTRQLERLPNKQLLRLLHARCNQFPFGYERLLIAMFPRLEQLEDGRLPQQDSKREIDRLSQSISNTFVEGYSVGLRLIDFLSSMQDQIGIKRELRNRTHSATDEGSRLKLLHENMPKDVAIQFHKYYAQYHNRTRQLLVQQRLELQQNLIQALLKCEVKCVCRPVNYREEMLRSFTEIFDKVLLHFGNDYDKRLLNDLQRRVSQRKTFDQEKFNRDSEYARECLLFEFHMMAPAQSRFDDQPGKYLQKINPLLLQNRSVLLKDCSTNLPKGQLRNVNEDSHIERLMNLPVSHSSQHRKTPQSSDGMYDRPQYLYDQLTDRVPVLEYTPLYSEVLCRVLLDLVFRVVNLHSQILADRHAEHINLHGNPGVFEYTFDQHAAKENIPQGNQQTNVTAYVSVARLPLSSNQQPTIVDYSPPKPINQTRTVKRQSTLGQFNAKHAPSPQQFEVHTDQFRQPTSNQPTIDTLTAASAYDLSLKFKVLSALLLNCKQRKTLLKPR